MAGNKKSEEIMKCLPIKIAILASLFWALMICLVHAEIDSSKAVRAIIGEASNQGYKGMLAIACGIRNRGHLKGVYGLNAKHIDKEPRWIFELAERAWKESKYKDITFGATHWESDLFKEPYWAKYMVKTVKIGNHQFYKNK